MCASALSDAFRVFVALLGTTKWLMCKSFDRIEVADESKPDDDEVEDPPLAFESRIPGLSQFVSVSMWEKHWLDCGSLGYKRRWIRLLDDMQCPSWTCVNYAARLLKDSSLVCGSTILLCVACSSHCSACSALG